MSNSTLQPLRCCAKDTCVRMTAKDRLNAEVTSMRAQFYSSQTRKPGRGFLFWPLCLLLTLGGLGIRAAAADRYSISTARSNFLPMDRFGNELARASQFEWGN